MMSLLPPKLSLLYTGLLGIMYVLLSINVIRYRWVERRGLGNPSNQDSKLFRAIRIHANFMEYVPFILLMLFLEEITGGPANCIHIMGSSLLVGRICHAIGINKTQGPSPGRSIGVFMTFATLIYLCVRLITKGLS